MTEYNNEIRGIIAPMPGADIDTLIYEQIMGWKKINGIWMSDLGDYRVPIMMPPHYSSCDSDALRIADICKVFFLEKQRKGWYCELRLEECEEVTTAHAGTLAFAVCMAILRQPYDARKADERSQTV